MLIFMPSVPISLNPRQFNCVKRRLLVADEKAVTTKFVFEFEGVFEHFVSDLYAVHSLHRCTCIVVYYRVPERHTVFSLLISLAA